MSGFCFNAYEAAALAEHANSPADRQNEYQAIYRERQLVTPTV